MNEEFDSHPAYQDRIDRAQSRVDALRDFVPTARDRFAAELLLLAIPVGWGLRGLRGLHYGIKGARRINVGKFGTRYYDDAAKRFVSRDVYRSRAGLPRAVLDTARMPNLAYKRQVARVQSRFPRTSRAYRRIQFIRDPVETLKRRHIPYYGFGLSVAFGYDRYRRVRRYMGDTDRSADPGDPIGGGPLPPASSKPSIRTHKTGTRSQNRGCPPGHRWSRKLRKCVPLRRKRS